MKKCIALLLTLCLMLGLPFAVSAVGTENPTEFKLLYAMEMPDWMAKNEADKGRTILLYFNSKPSAPADNVYFELLGYKPNNTNLSSSDNSRTMAYNSRYGKWGETNMIAVTIDKNLNGDYTEESTLTAQFGNTNYVSDMWRICISQPGGTDNDSLINGWTNSLSQTLGADGRRKPYVIGGPTLATGDALFVPITKKANLLTMDSAVLADDKVTVTFSESVYMEKSRYGSAASLRVVDENYNVVKYDAANTETPYSTTAGTDLTVVLDMQNAYTSTLVGTYSNPAGGKISGLTLKEHLDAANAQNGSNGYRLCFSLGDGGYDKLPNTGEGANNKFVDSVWSYDAQNGHTYKPLVGNQYDGKRDRAWCEVTVVSYAASVNGTPCETLAEALTAAESGQTVSLLKDTTLDSVNVSAGVTLDLAGNILTASHVIAIGKITDTTDGAGLIAMPANDGTDEHLLAVPADNGMLPLYDSENEGYRFLNLQIKHEQRAAQDGVMFGTMLNTNETALRLLSDPANAGATLTMKMPLTVDGVEKTTLIYPFKAATITEYAQKTLEDPDSTYAIVLSVYGFSKLDTDVALGATPILGTSTAATANGGAQTYTYTVAQGE